MVSHDEIKNDTLGMINHTKEMLEMIYDGFRKHNLSSIGKVEEVEEKLYKDSECLLKSILRESSNEDIKHFISVPEHFDRTGKGLNKLFNATTKKIREDMLFSDKSIKEAYKLFDETLVLLKSVSNCISTSNGDLAKHMDGNGNRLCELADEYAVFHEDRLIAGVCAPKSAPVYLDILESFRSVIWHVRKILQEYFVELKRE
jgi:Na+/phosphate symporter